MIINFQVSQEPHDFYKSIACPIIKISMVGITNFENRLPNTTVYWVKRVW